MPVQKPQRGNPDRCKGIPRRGGPKNLPPANTGLCPAGNNPGGYRLVAVFGGGLTFSLSNQGTEKPKMLSYLAVPSGQYYLYYHSIGIF